MGSQALPKLLAGERRPRNNAEKRPQWSRQAELRLFWWKLVGGLLWLLITVLFCRLASCTSQSRATAGRSRASTVWLGRNSGRKEIWITSRPVAQRAASVCAQTLANRSCWPPAARATRIQGPARSVFVYVFVFVYVSASSACVRFSSFSRALLAPLPSARPKLPRV